MKFRYPIEFVRFGSLYFVKCVRVCVYGTQNSSSLVMLRLHVLVALIKFEYLIEFVLCVPVYFGVL